MVKITQNTVNCVEMLKLLKFENPYVWALTVTFLGGTEHFGGKNGALK